MRVIKIVFAALLLVALAQPLTLSAQSGLSESKIIAGLKEALDVGVGNAVNLTGRMDGFFRNAAIKILLPKQLTTVAKTMRAVGQGALVDEFELSMNRAAEKAAPQARRIFVDAIKQMTFNDARRILTGGDTAATQYFRERTVDELSRAFAPIVERAMDDVGATRKYKDLTRGLQNLPFGRAQSLDIDDYVVSKALDGLFYMVGEEEKKIRKNPVARVSSILQEVFGGLGGGRRRP